MEYIEGGELYSILKTHRRFNEDQARFYLAEIILGIEFLHIELDIIYRLETFLIFYKNNNNVINRDLKPENILLK